MRYSYLNSDNNERQNDPFCVKIKSRRHLHWLLVFH
jgi:hypothetical protein